ncbi:hypothetical protein [Fastidiosibacter lacustris]|uniref:hypothetical protein n=1 Tax=Fastidiosibacter lacustris TaxID=2056695 RepID=UPI000E348AAD|nr:hypothetical protein [Fastidiosibacter lacustris]
MKKIIVLLWASVLLSNIGFTNDKKDKQQQETKVVHSCSAQTSHCEFNSNWELFKQDVLDVVHSGKQVTKDVLNQTGEYTQKTWQKVKDVTAECWENTKEVAQQGDDYFRINQNKE